MSIEERLLVDRSALSSLLTPVQLDAVLYDGGDSLILAGAGSGKTRVLIYKIARLIGEKKAFPDEIFAVTFTNKAAGEMKERAALYLGYPVHLPWLGTFHSICVRIMRRWLPDQPRGSFRSRHFTIYDDDDSRKLASVILARPAYRDSGIDARRLLRTISNWKSNWITPSEAAQETYHPEGRLLAELYGEYEKSLAENNALDFDDLLICAVRLLERDPEVLGALRTRFKYLFVDEYQDTNAVQYRLVRLLAGHAGAQLTVVGDDDQSIYGWRGADVGILRSFVADFPDAVVFKLEENFRSSSNIVTAAGAVIRNNRRIQGLEKHVFSQQPAGDPVRLIRLYDDAEEARRTAEIVQLWSPEERANCAVFYRTNAQSRLLEKAFAQARIPCRIYGGVGFFQRKEIKDLFAYLRLLLNPLDEISLRRIINVPRRGIGEVSVQKLASWAQENGVPMSSALGVADSIIGRSGKKLTELHRLLTALREMIASNPLPVLVEQLIEQSGYRAALLAEGGEEAMARVENIDELLNDVQEREENFPGTKLEDFLQEVALATDADRDGSEATAVRLMTLHAAKGLEFKNVMIVGCNERLLPLYRDDSGRDELEEERRLFYVGMTRARERLWLLCTTLRRIRGREDYAQPSPFLAELERSVCQFSPSARAFGFLTTEERSEERNAKSIEEIPKRPASFDALLRAGLVRKANAPMHSSDVSDESQENLYLQVGSRVSHPRFGKGVVLSASGSEAQDRVTIRFADGSERCLVLRFASLTLLR